MKHDLYGRTSRLAMTLAVVSAGIMASAQEKLPIYEVTSPLMSPSSAMAINKYLKLTGALDTRSVFTIDQRSRIQLVPQKLISGSEKPNEDGGEIKSMAVDMDAFKALKSWPREESLSRTTKALQAGGVVLPGAKALVSESQLSLRDTKGKEMATRNLETIVGYQFSLDGVPMVGPGFKTRFAFAPSGDLIQANITGWNVKKGPEVGIISKGEALRQAQTTFGTSNVKLNAKLVYYAPPADFQPKYLYPHYEISGTKQVGDEIVELRKMFVPAVQDSLKANINVICDGSVVTARPEIKGGRAPFKLQWSSATTDLVKQGNSENSIQYQVLPRRGMDKVQETLRLIVTDADGVQTVAEATPQILAFSGQPLATLFAASNPFPTAKVRQPGRYDGAIEWIDWANNASNCRNEMNSQGLPVQFFWGEMSAWEQDFKKGSAGGDDTDWVDDVDITFYTGHANGDGFVFKSNMQDTFLHYNDASWGEREAEWIVIAACGPLQPTEGGRGLERWLPSFQGLHILMGYGNVSYDSSQEGSKFMSRALRNSSPMRIRDAWISTASEEQPSDVLMGLMGPLRDDWVWNWDDYFWGSGTVGPDIPASRIIGYWYYVVPC